MEGPMCPGRRWLPRYAGPVPISSKLLSEDEEVVVDVRPHWLFLFGPAVLSALAVVVAVAVVLEFPTAPLPVGYVLAAMVAVPLLWLLTRILRWLGISLVFTTQRVIYRRGVFGRDFIQLRLSRITEVHSAQSLWERLVGSGRLVMEVSAEDPLVVGHVRRPRVLQRILNDQLLGPAPSFAAASPEPADHAFDPTPPHGTAPVPRRGTAEGGAVGAADTVVADGGSIPDKLIQLDDLRRRGILSEWEFEVKKAELLSRL